MSPTLHQSPNQHLPFSIYPYSTLVNALVYQQYLLNCIRIKNPLAGLTKTQIIRGVEEFAQEYNVIDILPELKKGALVARDPEEFETVSELTESELTALRDEVLHKWRQPKQLYFTIILCSIGAAVQYVTPKQTIDAVLRIV